MHYTKSLLYSS